MFKRSLFLILIFSTLYIISAVQSEASGQVTRHDTEQFTFLSGHFKVVGELRIPSGDGKYPLVIMVHGDGPAYRHYFFSLKKCFLRAGYATMMWDKPGFGRSTGKFSNSHLRRERADILLDAVNHIKSHPRIYPNRIGVWGISQAGYVIPMAYPKTRDISFMILVGCPGEDGIHQTAYLIRRQLEFEGLSKEEAKANEEADKEAREKVDKLNAADSLIFQTEKQLKDFGDKLPADKKEPIEKAVEALKQAHKSQDIDAIEKATAELNSVWQAASEEMYKASQQAEAGAESQEPKAEQQNDSKGDDEVTDVDFEEVK